MTEEELPPEEMNKIFEGCAAVMVMTFFGFLAYFVYLMRNNAMPSLWSFVTLWGLPFSFSFVSTGIVAFELLYHRKIKKPLQFHLKRATGRIILLLIGTLPLVLFIELADTFLSPFLGDRGVLLGPFIWMWIFVLFAWKFRNFIRKLDSGRW